MLAFAQKIFGSTNQKIIKSFYKIVEQINSLEPAMQLLCDSELFVKTKQFKEELTQGKTLEDLIVPAFAVVREASKRILNMRHFDVQLIGGIALHKGMIAEMKTGEGKTLVATLAAYLNSLNGKGVHIVTVNDYLAKRDSEWMGKLYSALGVSFGCITSNLTDLERKNIYDSDVVYSTNNELGFDYLRDNMKLSRAEMVQRGFNFAIIDEVDSILIDEARTPLIISGQLENNNNLYYEINKLVYELSSNDYILDEKNKSLSLTEEGAIKIELLIEKHNLIPSTNSLYDIDNIVIMHHVDQALRAHKLFSINKDYIIKDNQIVIIDEFTGRMMEGRRYSDGLHQALEAKEGLNINSENQTLASTTFQNYFRMYNKLAGMTGTASTESEEFWGIYKLHVTQMPTNLPVKRIDLNDNIYCTEEEKFDAVINLISECNKKLQPVLVGTISIEKSELLSKFLMKKNLKHAVLNARYHEQEAYIIAQAGRPGAITIATNMAGRGTDIQLGGNPEMLAKTELSHIKDENIRNEKYKELSRKVESDKETVIKAGGLCVIGTERHESRRIDNQLRGRSGRQGDPGLSQFFLSLEDDLLRIFGSDKIKGMLQKLGLKKNESIQHPWISKALERAQSKVEARNYDIRKSLLKFDDVINEQRKVIFEQRNYILDSESYDLSLIFKEVNDTIVDQAVSQKYYDMEEDDFNTLISEITRVYGITLNTKDIDKFDNKDQLIDYINSEISNLFLKKKQFFDKEDQNLWDCIVKKVMIATLDSLWQAHLSALDSLRHGINLRAIGQKDPLNEFKREAYNMLKSMLSKFQELVIQRLSFLSIDYNSSNNEQKMALSSMNSKNKILNKISRNDPCTCGSGIKYKHCHGRYK